MRIHGTEREISNEIIGFLSENLGELYEVVSDYRAFPSFVFDLAILRNRDIIALIEVKKGAMMYGKNPMMFDARFNKRTITGAKYLVVTDGDDYCVFSKENPSPTIVKGGDFVRCILKEYPMTTAEPDLMEVQSVLISYSEEESLKSLSNYLRKKAESLQL